MAEASFLVCPACRRIEDGRLVSHPLERGPLGLRCPGCGADHPVIDEIPLVLRDLDAWLAEEAPTLLCRQDLPAPLLARLAWGAGGTLWRDQQRLAIYHHSPDGPLHAWLRQVLVGLTGALLELGCGTGHHGDRRVIGLDLHWGSLRQHPGPRVLADALDPPFPGASFDAVLAINLLDSCRDPSLLLQQADALLAPGGTLVLASPFHWQEAVTPRTRWMQPEQVDAFLHARGYRLERGEADWTLALDERTSTTHRCATWIARRDR